MKDRDKALESLKRLSNELPDRVFIDADEDFYAIAHGNDRSPHKRRGFDVLKMVHIAIREYHILYQIVLAEDKGEPHDK